MPRTGRPKGIPKVVMKCHVMPPSLRQFQDLALMLGLTWGGDGSPGYLVDFIGSLPAAKLTKLAEFMRELGNAS